MKQGEEIGKRLCLANGGTLLFLTKLGSHFTGTETEESNVNYRGVYLPSKRHMVCGLPLGTLTARSKPDEDKLEAKDWDMQIEPIQVFLGMTNSSNSLRKTSIGQVELLYSMGQLERNVLYHESMIYKLIFEKRKRLIQTWQLGRFVRMPKGLILQNNLSNNDKRMRYVYHSYRISLMGNGLLKGKEILSSFGKKEIEFLKGIKSGEIEFLDAFDKAKELVESNEKLYAPFKDSKWTYNMQTAMDLIMKTYSLY